MIPGVEILAPLSSGGMGEVWLGRKFGALGFEKLVAVKKIRSDFLHREDVRAMFQDEARLLSRLSHPAIAQIFDFGEEDGSLFIVMEYVAGVSFLELLETQKVAPGLAAKMIAEVCRALHAAHELADLDGRSFQVVHRDITPDNLVLGFDGGVKILDFGIALMRDRLAPVTMVGAIRGKRAYLAPEQLNGQTIDRRTDIYGASAVLFELVTGPRTFEPGAALPDHTPHALAKVIVRGLAEDRNERFRDAREMADALDHLAAELGSERIEAFAERALAAKREAHSAKMRTWSAPKAPRVTEVDAPPPQVVAKRSPILYLGPAALIGAFLIWAAWPEQPVPALVATPKPPPPAPPAPVVLVPERAPEPEPPKKAPRRRPQPQPTAAVEQAAPAQLTIGATPYALIYVDGKQVGPTPIVELVTTAGEHRIRAVEPDTDRVRFDQTITLAPGEHKRLTIRP